MYKSAQEIIFSILVRAYRRSKRKAKKWSNRRSLCLLLIAVCMVSYATNTYMLNDVHVRIALNVKSSSAVTTQKSNEQQQQLRHGVVEVHSVGNFIDRVAEFNAFLSSLRVEELKRRGTDSWQGSTSSRLDVVSGARDDYLQLLSNYSKVLTIALPWLASSSVSPQAWSSLQDHSNLLIQSYYKLTADDTLCSWIETPGKMQYNYDVMYNRKCNRDVNDTVRPVSLGLLFLNEKPIRRNLYWPNNGTSYPAYVYTATPTYVFYMHIHRDAIVTELGDVITDGLKLVLYGCSPKGPNINPFIQLFDNLERIPLYSELFVINQYWGTQTYHRMTEIMPRLALHLQFLKVNPEIRISAPEVGGRLAELLEIIGLDSSRLVAGVARAKIVYQPGVTACIHANIPESQMLSQLYRDYIKRTFPPQPRNRLILIRRSGLRRFSEQKAIEGVVKRAARDYNLTYTMFIDDPTPSLNDTMIMFHSAIMIVAPHGAGLSNMLFSQSGTYILEGVCNVPHVNMCFQWLAYVSDIVGTESRHEVAVQTCMVDVSTVSIDSTLRAYLGLLLSHH